MTEKKAQPGTKKVTTEKVGSAVTRKPKAAKKAVAKKPAIRSAAAEDTALKNPKVSATKKAAAPAGKIAPKKKSPETKPAISKAKPSSAAKPAVKPTPEERYSMVETAAYFIAEQHGFQGRSDEHWAAAERQIAARLGQ